MAHSITSLGNTGLRQIPRRTRMFKMRVRQGRKLTRKESAQDRDTSMHRLIWSAVRNWVPMPDSAFAPSERGRGAPIEATASPRRLMRTRVTLAAAPFPPVPDSNAHTAAMAPLHRGTNARADMGKLQHRAAKVTSDYAESFLLIDPDQVLDQGQRGTRLH
jgi:hypothetical protein